MARSIHESVLAISRLYDPALTSETRLARMAGVQLRNVQGSLVALEAFPREYQQEKERVAGAIVGIRKYMEEAGYVIHDRKDDPFVATGISWGLVKETLRDNATATSLLYTPSIHYNWVLGSGAAHSKPWYIRGLSGPWETLVVGTLAPLLDISDLLIDIILGYVGLPVDSYHRSTHLRRCTLFHRTNPEIGFGSYEHYRQQASSLHDPAVKR